MAPASRRCREKGRFSRRGFLCIIFARENSPRAGLPWVNDSRYLPYWTHNLCFFTPLLRFERPNRSPSSVFASWRPPASSRRARRALAMTTTTMSAEDAAATKLQAHYKGHFARKQVDEMRQTAADEAAYEKSNRERAFRMRQREEQKAMLLDLPAGEVEDWQRSRSTSPRSPCRATSGGTRRSARWRWRARRLGTDPRDRASPSWAPPRPRRARRSRTTARTTPRSILRPRPPFARRGRWTRSSPA